MSVLAEKNALKAAFTTVLGNAISFIAPDSAANHVFMYLLPEPNSVWPALVLERPHWTQTEVFAGGGAVKGNDDNDPNIYRWSYHDTLISVSGSTVEATMDTHDVFLEALAAYFASRTNQYLPDGNGIKQCNGCGETITSDANPQGPYNLSSGSSTLLSEGQIHVKSLYRNPTA